MQNNWKFALSHPQPNDTSLPGLNAIDEAHDGHQYILLQPAARSFTEVGGAREPRTGTQATANAAGWHQQLPKIGPGHLPHRGKKCMENNKKERRKEERKKGTQRNPKEPKGTQRNPKEPKEPKGTQRNPKEPQIAERTLFTAVDFLATSGSMSF